MLDACDQAHTFPAESFSEHGVVSNLVNEAVQRGKKLFCDNQSVHVQAAIAGGMPNHSLTLSDGRTPLSLTPSVRDSDKIRMSDKSCRRFATIGKATGREQPRSM